MKAIWNNTVVAGSEGTVLMKDNHYFAQSSLKPVAQMVCARVACATSVKVQ